VDRVLVVLFVCRGNYFRSRFAEILFNHLVRTQGIAATAVSRGLNFSGNNAGPISTYVPVALKTRNIPHINNNRKPMKLCETDLQVAHVVVLTHADQQLPQIREQYPHHLSRLIHWDVPDVTFTREDVADAAANLGQLSLYEAEALEVLGKIERHVLGLVTRLQAVLANKRGIHGQELVELLSERVA
jgi:protein-tyrosine phosphatase